MSLKIVGGRKAPSSSANPFQRIRRQSDKKVAATGPVFGGSLMKRREIGLSKSSTAFQPQLPRLSFSSSKSKERAEEWSKKFFHNLKKEFNLCNTYG